MTRIFGMLAVAIMVALSPTEASGTAQTAFEVRGSVRNGTAGAPLPPDLGLRLVMLRDGQMAGSWEVTADADGSFSFVDVPLDPVASYVVGAVYQDVAYVNWVDAPRAGALTQAELNIYEASITDPGLRFERSALMISNVDQGARTLTILEVHAVVNPSDRTFAPRTDGPGGAAGLFVFGLPPNAFDLTLEAGLDPERAVQIGLGFASLNPVLPGRSEVAYRYRVPYTDAEYAFQKNIRYPTGELRVLYPAGGVPVAAERLQESADADIGGRAFKALAGGPFSPGDAVRVTVSSLPVPFNPLGRVPPLAIAVIGAVLGAAVLIVLWRRTRLAAAPVTAAGGGPEELIEQMVQLDLDREAGRIDDADYDRARAALLARYRAGELPG